MTRRDALRALLATGVGAVSAPFAYGAAYERHRFVRVEQDIAVSGLPPAVDGLRVGLLTDVHHSASVPAEDVRRAVALLASAKPDLIVLGGDYVTYGNRGFVEPVAELLAPLANAAARIVCRPRQSRRRSRHGGGVVAPWVHRAERSAHDAAASTAKRSISPVCGSGRGGWATSRTCSRAPGRRRFCSRTIHDG